MNKSKLPLIILPLLLVWAAALILASFIDLDLSLAVADPLSGFGRVLEIIGEPPAILFTSFNFALLIAYFQKKPERQRRDNILTVLSLIGMVGAAFYTIYQTFDYIAEYRSDLSGNEITAGPAELMASMLICIVICGAMLFFSSRLSYDTLQRVQNAAAHCVFAAISTLVIIWCFKLIWGRVRFRQLDGDYSRFTPWYLPQGFTGYFSFPSGHTANAAVIFTATYYLRFLPERLRRLKPLAWGLLSAWIVLLALSRVLVGAHYLSDVLCGAMITFIIVYFWKPKDAEPTA